MMINKLNTYLFNIFMLVKVQVRILIFFPLVGSLVIYIKPKKLMIIKETIPLNMKVIIPT